MVESDRRAQRRQHPYSVPGGMGGMPGGMGGTQLPMGKAVYQAACDGNEAELRRLIRLGGSVNCHIPEVRLRMPRVIVALSLRRQRRVRTSQLHVTRGADGFAAAPPTRRPSHVRPRRSARLSSIALK